MNVAPLRCRACGYRGPALAALEDWSSYRRRIVEWGLCRECRSLCLTEDDSEEFVDESGELSQKDIDTFTDFDSVREAPMRRDLVRALSYRPDARTLLDAGTGTGLAAGTAISMGIAAVGAEPNPKYREFCRAKGIDVPWRFVEEVDRRFDVVTAMDVVEHIPDPVSFLSRIRQALRDDGIVVARVPTAGYARLKTRLLTRLRPGQYSSLNGPIHVTYFTPKGASALFERAGLSVAGIWQSWSGSHNRLSNLLQRFALGVNRIGIRVPTVDLTVVGRPTIPRKNG